MRIFVVGANGRTGREIVAGAPPAEIRKMAVGVVLAVLHDIVISALGNGLSLRDGRAPKILAAATEQLVGGMQRAGVRRLVTMLSYGSGATG